PGDVSARFGLADTLAKSGDFEGSIKEYKELLHRKADHAEARYRLALALLEVGSRSDAIAALRETIHHRPDHAGARRVLDTVLKQE
ncbi:MAG: tetratricopeptide repeat protein, partial [Phycisphaerales bacterium]